MVEQLSAKSQVRVIERKGKWHKVIAASNATGWVNMMHLRGEVTVVASASGSGFFSGVTSVLGASSGNSQKSQGATLDELWCDLGALWEPGQAYVALSRLRDSKGLHIVRWNAKSFIVDPHVEKFYKSLI